MSENTHVSSVLPVRQVPLKPEGGVACKGRWMVLMAGDILVTYWSTIATPGRCLPAGPKHLRQPCQHRAIDTLTHSCFLAHVFPGSTWRKGTPFQSARASGSTLVIGGMTVEAASLPHMTKNFR